jgi:D-alanyl-D-alanine carboxypeptidase/D-alanyl-D-alanine-endopeptidase (penicillin-binding protein 4)
MRRAWLLVAILAAGTLRVPAAAGAPATTASGVGRRVLDRFQRGGLKAGKAGLCVVSLDTGELVAESSASLPLVPASVAKLATAATALDLLGPGHRFTTSVEARGAVDAGGTLSGDLVVRGSGDPNLSKRGKPDDPMFPLRDLAAAVAGRGIRRVAGSLVLDDGGFDRRWVHPSWPAGDVAKAYGAGVAGLSWNDACVTVLVRGASSPGGAARVEAPSTAGPWSLENAVETVAGGRAAVGGRWVESGKSLRVEGDVAPGAEVLFDVPVPDPLAHFGAAFAQALASAGVVVAGGVRPAELPADRRPGTTVASFESALAPTLAVMNRRSQNFYAASVFKACGAAFEGAGSWEAGERAAADALARRGAFDPGSRVVDGAGLSKDDRLTAGGLARLLASFDRDLLRGPVLRASLATPGDPDGTLRKRLLEPEARARARLKTGSLSNAGVHALAGYVEGRGGKRGFAFAVLLGAVPQDGDANDLLDDVVRELLEG